MSNYPIFCFICDCEGGYFKSTLRAINSLRKHTKKGKIGIIFPPSAEKSVLENREIVEQNLKEIDPKVDLSNILYREGQRHFENWSPAQHKLDVQLFATQFDPIVWMDSDTLVLKNLFPAVEKFVNSNKQLGFLRDSLNDDPGFKKRWEGPLFIPQSNFMIFRASAIKKFFKIWEDTWTEWITPQPFALHKDPAPFYKKSVFDIEKYALGQAVCKYVENNFDRTVDKIDRLQVFFGRDLSLATQADQRDFLLTFSKPTTFTLPDFATPPQRRFIPPTSAEDNEYFEEKAAQEAAQVVAARERATKVLRTDFALEGTGDGGDRPRSNSSSRRTGLRNDSPSKRRGSRNDSPTKTRALADPFASLYPSDSKSHHTHPDTTTFASPFEVQEEEANKGEADGDNDSYRGMSIPEDLSGSQGAFVKAEDTSGSRAGQNGREGGEDGRGGEPDEKRKLNTYVSDASCVLGNLSPTVSDGFAEEVPEGSSPLRFPSPALGSNLGRRAASQNARQKTGESPLFQGRQTRADSDVGVGPTGQPYLTIPGIGMTRDSSQASCASTASSLGMSGCASQELF